MATEKIKLLDLDLDVEKLTKKAADSQKSIEFLKDEVKFFQNTIKEGDKIIENSRDKLLELEKQGKKDTEEYRNLSKSLEEFNQKQEQNRQKMELVGSELRKNQKEYRNTKRQLDVYNKTVEDELGIITKTDGSINQLNQAVANNRKVYRDLTKEQRENEEIGGRLLKLINEQDREYKDLQKSIGTTQVEVGNYKEQIKEALKESSSFSAQMDAQLAQIPVVGSSLSVTAKHLRGYAQGQATAAAATSGGTKALKLFRLALISTGIGAIVVALGALVAYLTSTQSGINAINKVLVPLKTVFQTLFGLFQEVGEVLFDAFANPKETIEEVYNFVKDKVIRVFNGYWKVLSGIATMDFSRVKEGVQDVGDVATEALGMVTSAANRVGEAVEEAWKRGQQIADLQQELSASEADYIRQTSALKEEFKEQNKLAEDQSKTLAEREAAAKRSIDIQKEINSLEDDRLQKQIELMKLQQQSNDTSDEERAELAQLEAQRNESRARQLEAETTQQNKLNTIRKSANDKAIAAAKARMDAEIKASQTALDRYILDNDKVNSTLAEREEFYRQALQKETDILDQQLKARKITQEEYEIALIEIKQEYAQKSAEATVQNLQYELDLYLEQNKSKLDSERALTEGVVQEERSRLQQVYDQQLAILEEQRANELISEQDFNLQKLQLTADFLQQQKDVEDQFNLQKKEAEQIDYENELEIRRLRGENEFTLRYEELERQKQLEVEAAKKRGEDVTKIEALYAERKKQIDNEVNRSKIEGASAVLDGLSDLLGQETAAGKAVAIAKATMDTYKAANLALSTYPPPFGQIAAGVAIATGLANVKKIVSTKTKVPKAEKGIAIDIGGNRHSAGGTKFYGEDGTSFEAERGEKMFVLSRRASAALGPLLSDVNQQYGGVALSNRSSYLAAGGQVIRNASRTIQKDAQIDYDLLAQKIAVANSQLPPPEVKVAVEDINYGQSNYAQVVNGANL